MCKYLIISGDSSRCDISLIHKKCSFRNIINKKCCMVQGFLLILYAFMIKMGNMGYEIEVDKIETNKNP